MRPQGYIRVDLAAALIDGGGTSRDLMQRTGWSRYLTMRTLDSMVTAGDVRKTRYVRVPGCKRPVPWYERAVRDEDMAGDGEPIVDLIAAWARLPVQAQQGTAM